MVRVALNPLGGFPGSAESESVSHSVMSGSLEPHGLHSPPGSSDHEIYAEYITWNARLDESQAGIKISGRNNSSLRYADDTTVMAESEEKLKSLLMRVKEESENSPYSKNWYHGIWSLHFITNRREEKYKQWQVFLGSQITEWWLQSWS